MSTEVPGMADAIERRRLELGMTIGDLADAAGITRQGLDPVRRGEHRSYNDRTIMGVARALRWDVDWLDRLIAGRRPREVRGNLLPDDGEDWNQFKSSLSEEDRAAIRTIIDGLIARRKNT